MVVAEEAGTVVGYSFFRLYGSTGHVVHVAVAPGSRRRGVGRALVERVRRHLVEAGCSRLSISTSV